MSPNSISRSQANQNVVPETPSDKTFSVLHIDNNIGETSAAYNEHVLSKAEDYDVSVCCFYESPVKVPSTVSLFEGNGNLRSFYRSLKSSLRSAEYDIIHIHAPHVGVLTFFYLLFFKPQELSRTVYTVHNSYHNYRLKHRLLHILPFAVYRNIVHCSWSSYHSFPWLYRKLAGKLRTAVPNGVDVDRVSRVLDKAVKSSKGIAVPVKRKITSIGRLIATKNFHTLIDSKLASDFPEVVLEIFGKGELRQSLQSKIDKEAKHGDVVLRGVVPRDDVYSEIANSDVFISTSRGEGLPIAVMEAMCCGCPVVLSDIPPHREIAEECDFIRLIEPDDTKGFTAELNRILSLSDQAREALGEKCQKLVVDCFSLEAMHQGYKKIYMQRLSAIDENTGCKHH